LSRKYQKTLLRRGFEISRAGVLKYPC